MTYDGGDGVGEEGTKSAQTSKQVRKECWAYLVIQALLVQPSQVYPQPF
jgi:hypothetical protein